MSEARQKRIARRLGRLAVIRERSRRGQPDEADVCVCGCLRARHQGGTGPCRFNGMHHVHLEECARFRLAEKAHHAGRGPT